MSIAVIQRPIKSTCNFNAVGNPIIYKLERRDYEFNQINDSSGFAQIQINGVNHTSYFQVGNTVYVNRTGYNKTATITASTFSGGNTLVTLNIAHAGSGTGALNNLSKRTDYRVDVTVFDYNNIALSPALAFTPFTDGQVLVDVSSVAKTYVRPEWHAITGTNQVEEETSVRFYISYREFYDDAYSGAATSDSGNPTIGVHAVMPILLDVKNLTQYPHGGNMLRFMPVDVSRFWLTRFAIGGGMVPMWRGYPFSLTFLWRLGIPEIKRRIVQKDEQGEYVTSTTVTLTETMSRVHRMALGTINVATKFIEVTLLDENDDELTTTLTVEVREPCDNPVHLFWKNSYGGDSYYQFEYDQEYSYVYGGGMKRSRLTLFANDLSLGAWEAIQELNSPSDVIPVTIRDTGMDTSIIRTQYRDDQQVYLLNQEGTVKIGVTVIPTENVTRTKYYIHNAEVQIELPESFTI